MLNSQKKENLINEIKNIINNSEIIDENYIFTFAKNYTKEHSIEISKGEIKSIINNLINQFKNNGKIKNIDSDLHCKNEIEFEKNPLQQLITSTEKDFLI